MSEQTWQLIPPDVAVANVMVRRIATGDWEMALGLWDAETSSFRLGNHEGPLVLNSGDTLKLTYSEAINLD